MKLNRRSFIKAGIGAFLAQVVKLPKRRLHYKTFGDFLRAAKVGEYSPLMVDIRNADGTGGFLVPPDFAEEIIRRFSASEFDRAILGSGEKPAIGFIDITEKEVLC